MVRAGAGVKVPRAARTESGPPRKASSPPWGTALTLASTRCDLWPKHVCQCHWGEDSRLHGAWKLLLHVSEPQDYPGHTQSGFRPTQTESQGLWVNGTEGLLLVLTVIHEPLTFLSLRHNLQAGWGGEHIGFLCHTQVH